MDDYNAVYYRVIRSYKDGQPTVVCCQWFDEFDYDQSRFLTEEKFTSEEVANAWLTTYLRLISPVVVVIVR